MKNSFRHYIILSACILLSSCKVQQLTFTDSHLNINHENFIINSDRGNNNSIRLNPAFRNIGVDSIVVFSSENQNFSKELSKYTFNILKHSHSDYDSIIALIPGKLILLKNKLNDNNISDLPIDYVYSWNFKDKSWICYQNDSFIPGTQNQICYHRQIFKSEKLNLIIIKDIFPKISAIYIIQGQSKYVKDIKPSVLTTSVWSPSSFKSFITSGRFIQKNINPVSEFIALRFDYF